MSLVTTPTMKCGRLGCESIEFDVHLYNVGLLLTRCRKCGQHYKKLNPSYPLQIRALMIEKKGAVQVVEITDEGVKTMMAEKDLENERLKQKLRDAGIEVT